MGIDLHCDLFANVNKNLNITCSPCANSDISSNKALIFLRQLVEIDTHFDLSANCKHEPTLEYLISVPHLLSVPADKFPKIPVRLLDP